MVHLVFHKRLACGWSTANWSSKKDDTKQISTVSTEKKVVIKLVWVCDTIEMLKNANIKKFITPDSYFLSVDQNSS